MNDAQIVVAGAGHNSLITAAYLAVAGYSVIVLDARSVPGRSTTSIASRSRRWYGGMAASPRPCQ